MTENKHNYYEILDLKPGATQHDILVAYQKAKFTYSFSNLEIMKVFTESELHAFRNLIEEAYSVLKDAGYRSIYEKKLQKNSDDPSLMSFEAIKNDSHDFQSVTIPEHVSNKIKDKENKAGLEKTEKPVIEPSISVQSFETDNLDEAFENEITNQTVWSGDFLKKVREYKKISFEKLQEKTKVNPWYLKALETMDPKNLPAPVFVRGYVAQMARELGLKEKEVTESYMKLYKNKLENNA